MLGGVLSMLMFDWVSEAVLPALSSHVPTDDWPAPSPLSVWLTEAATGPDSGSAQLQFTVTSPLFQPLPLAAVRLTKVMTGAVLSMLMPLAVAVGLVLPALSLQVPEADCPAPSALSVVAAVQKSIPDKLSLPAKVTVTLVLFQPLAFA